METLLKDSAALWGAAIVLTVSVGLYIFNSSMGSISDAMDSMEDVSNTVEVVELENDKEDDYITSVQKDKETFNTKWESYKGMKSGEEVKRLISDLKTNLELNPTEENKLIDLEYEATRGNTFTIVSTVAKPNKILFDTAKESIEIGNTYYVSIKYSDSTDYVEKIVISYDQPVYGKR
jgi:hypothetical protein